MGLGGVPALTCRVGLSWCVQMQCFGLAMVQLDIRQESTRHSDVLDAITTYLGIGSYKCALAYDICCAALSTHAVM